MVSCIKNEDGIVIAFIEWQILNDKAQFKDNGEYIYIQECWIHWNFTGNKTLSHLIYLIDKHSFCKNAKYVYWVNLKHNERQTKTYSRERLSKIGEKYEQGFVLHTASA